MLKKTAAVVVLSATALLGATPALADGYRQGQRYEQRAYADGYRHGHRYERAHAGYAYRAHRHAHQRVIVHRPVVHRPVVLHRPVVVRHQPTVVYRSHGSQDVLGGLIVGAVIGAAIASHGGY